jgi:agmatine/peptidylarginine deiminase
MARFLDARTVAVGAYPAVHVDERIFMDDIACMLAKDLGEDFRVVRIPDGPPAKGKSGNAAGSHLGFLRAGEYLLMPFYGTPEDDGACAALRSAVDGIEPVPVALPGVRLLAASGGVLNSICRPW